MRRLLVLSMSVLAAAVFLPTPTRMSEAKASAPAGAVDGLAILNRSCTSCHDKSQATQKRPAADWPPIIARMRDNGANISDADAKILLTYLINNYSSQK